MKSIASISLLLLQVKFLSAFVLRVPQGIAVSRSRSTDTSSSLSNGNKDVIDVEFSRSNDNSDGDDHNKSSSPQNQKPLSPLDASLNMIPPHLRIPIEFTDPISKSFIPCQVAFIVELEGVEFSVGTPVHAQVAIICEDDGAGQTFFVDTDLDENLEIMEVAAAKFEELNKINLIFARTPRTLTVQGDLDALIDGWRIEDRRPLTEEIPDILENTVGTQDDDEFFDAFFRKELGENYREEILGVDNPDLDKRAADMMDMFNIPGLGTEKDDDEGIQALMDEIDNDIEKISKNPNIATQGNDDQDEAALRLVGFEGPDGRPYSLVKLLQPTILVAKRDDRLAPDQRILLSKEEADEVIPILEKDFEAELSEAGLFQN
mmetsp:Transcript_857/g.981  ORF Transcript_857/g.981 Transcript_857/m.981 type:complete len:376 (+) Transcript_857:164-1291(+)|eukprot:CAMPEP_0204622612 /NCGR_PEP_ID=MMETSP0717-20131115/8285_1 /ASSEMBLY_ACC=CAM_ASM_000666 /TAXON_ID=230516 /ORGANISM="Chaetoceros curvisetus" /LENGTH=375 /DNA_ID=CAMNT_0051637397 /DNA_START=50 /DNA_END=1177 /DNA_ORIENTATION=-